MDARPFQAIGGSVRVALVSALFALSGSAIAQGGASLGWASDSDPVARQLIAQERKWAEMACLPRSALATDAKPLVESFIADDFVGTHPKGTLYTKADMLVMPKVWEPEQDCKLLSARVRYVQPDVAVIYGSESARVKGADGASATRTLVWTDTLLKRAGKWQIIAVQDMAMPAK